MKKLSTTILLMAAFAAIISFNACKKKVNDAELKTAIETVLKADPAAAGTLVSVEKGVATIFGECKDQASKDNCAALVKAIKGVKEVVNNCTVAAAPVPVINADDEALSKVLNDAVKANPGLQFAINEGKIALTGEISKAKWISLKQMLDKMKSKGYDLKGLIIK